MSYWASLIGTDDRLIRPLDSRGGSLGAYSASGRWAAIHEDRSMDPEREMLPS